MSREPKQNANMGETQESKSSIEQDIFLETTINLLPPYKIVKTDEGEEFICDALGEKNILQPHYTTMLFMHNDDSASIEEHIHIIPFLSDIAKNNRTPENISFLVEQLNKNWTLLKTNIKNICIKDIPHLYEDTLKLDPTDNSKILKYCDKYGLPSMDNSSKTIMLDNPPFSYKYPEVPELPYYSGFISKQNFIDKISRFKKFNLLWNSILNEDPSAYTLLANEEFANIGLSNLYTDEKNDNKKFSDIKSFLFHYINTTPNICNLRPSIKEVDGKYTYGFTFQSLLDVLYYKLIRKVTSVQQMKKCPACDKFFEVLDGRGGRRFCPRTDKNGKVISGRSTCENSYNHRKRI